MLAPMRDPLLPRPLFLIGANVVAALANVSAAYMNYRLGGWHMILMAGSALVATMSLCVAAWVWRRR